jgi:hypothetical protein
MNIEQVTEMLNYILSIYPKTFKFDKQMVNVWYNELQQYDYEDVKISLEELLKKDYPPVLTQITKGLRKIYDKNNIEQATMLCPRCRKPLTKEEYDEHFDRCSSIDYMIRETKKWFKREITRKFLWSMSKEEFDIKYKNLLKYIKEHTLDEQESTRISFIFNPPSKERAKKFLES